MRAAEALQLARKQTERLEELRQQTRALRERCERLLDDITSGEFPEVRRWSPKHVGPYNYDFRDRF